MVEDRCDARQWLRDSIETCSALLPSPGEVSTGALASGCAGIALFLHASAQVFSELGQLESRAIEYAERAVAFAQEEELPLGLFDGLCGIAWVAAHLSDHDGEDDSSEIDGVLLERLRAEEEWYEPSGVVDGLAGIAVYALSRRSQPVARDILASVVTHLWRLSEQHNDGIAWWTPGELYVGERQSSTFRGCYGNAFGRGASGILSTLVRIGRAGIEPELCELMVRGAAEWILSQRAPNRGYLLLSEVGPDVPRRVAGDSWLDGPAPTALALVQAARVFNEPWWEREALRSLRAWATARQSRPADAPGFALGTAGHTLALSRVAQLTEDPMLLAVAEQARASLRASWSLEGQPLGRLTDGATGTALALLLMSTPVACVEPLILLDPVV